MPPTDTPKKNPFLKALKSDFCPWLNVQHQLQKHSQLEIIWKIPTKNDLPVTSQQFSLLREQWGYKTGLGGWRNFGRNQKLNRARPSSPDTHSGKKRLIVKWIKSINVGMNWKHRCSWGGDDSGIYKSDGSQYRRIVKTTKHPRTKHLVRVILIRFFQRFDCRFFD